MGGDAGGLNYVAILSADRTVEFDEQVIIWKADDVTAAQFKVQVFCDIFS
jgi:hypothetical protein